MLLSHEAAIKSNYYFFQLPFTLHSSPSLRLRSLLTFKSSLHLGFVAQMKHLPTFAGPIPFYRRWRHLVNVRRYHVGLLELTEPTWVIPMAVALLRAYRRFCETISLSCQ